MKNVGGQSSSRRVCPNQGPGPPQTNFDIWGLAHFQLSSHQVQYSLMNRNCGCVYPELACTNRVFSTQCSSLVQFYTCAITVLHVQQKMPQNVHMHDILLLFESILRVHLLLIQHQELVPVCVCGRGEIIYMHMVEGGHTRCTLCHNNNQSQGCTYSLMVI